MSLDVTLRSQEKKMVMCYACYHEHEESEVLYEANITHNLSTMADKAGIYEALWRPEEINAVRAMDIIDRIERGLVKLKSNPDEYKKYDATNGWGTYEQFVAWVEKYLEALKEYPLSIIEVSR